jgi:DNA-binding NarL/FixJ family response regulator
MEPPHILIVAADRDIGELYTMFLGYPTLCQAQVVADADAARRALAAGRVVDAVVVDVTHPADFDACADLTGVAAGAPIVVVTGWIASDRRFRDRTFDAGCAAYVLKPCHPETLVEAVQRARNGERRIELVERHMVSYW